LEREYQSLLYQIEHAVEMGLSPQQVQELTNRALTIATNIYKLNPTAAAYDWYLQRLDFLERTSNEVLRQIGEEAVSAVDELLKELRPFVDFWLGVPVDVGAALELVQGSFAGFSDALDVLTQKINQIAGAGDHPQPGGDGGGGAGGDGGDHGGGGGGGGRRAEATYGGDTEPASVTINVNAPQLTDPNEVAQIVMNRLRRNPNLIDTPYR
jgi:hypothetical protein